MTPEAHHVADLIRTAFRGVTLGNGVGLLQGQGLDDYAGTATLAEYRERDEKDDWSRIPPELLDRCYSSLSFFDPEGMRFHLPAYLLADLGGTARTTDVTFHLTYTGHGAPEKFVLLSAQQKHAVRQFLLLKLADVTDGGVRAPVCRQDSDRPRYGLGSLVRLTRPRSLAAVQGRRVAGIQPLVPSRLRRWCSTTAPISYRPFNEELRRLREPWLGRGVLHGAHVRRPRDAHAGMVTVSIKLPEQMLKSLVAVASLETLRRGRRISWAALVRETITEHLLKPNSGVTTAITQSK